MNCTIEKAKNIFFNLYLKVERNYSRNTIAAYTRDIDDFLDFTKSAGIENLSDVDYNLSSMYVVKLNGSGLSPKSVNRRLAAIKTYYRFLLDNKIIKKQPGFLLLDCVKQGFKLPEYLTETEVVSLLEAVDENAAYDKMTHRFELVKNHWIRDRAFLELLYATGARVSEITNLEKSNINFNQNTIKVLGKNRQERIIPFGKFSKWWMLQYLEKIRPVLLKSKRPETGNRFFLSRRGRPMSRISAFNIVKRAAQIAGIEKNIYPHILRHSCATHLMNRDMPFECVAELLGHKSFNSTQLYTHVSIERLHKTLKDYHPRYYNNKLEEDMENDPKKLVRTNTHLSNDQLYQLDQMAKELNVKRSELIRQAVDEKIRQLKNTHKTK